MTLRCITNFESFLVKYLQFLFLYSYQICPRACVLVVCSLSKWSIIKTLACCDLIQLIVTLLNCRNLILIHIALEVYLLTIHILSMLASRAAFPGCTCNILNFNVFNVILKLSHFWLKFLVLILQPSKF